MSVRMELDSEISCLIDQFTPSISVKQKQDLVDRLKREIRSPILVSPLPSGAGVSAGGGTGNQQNQPIQERVKRRLLRRGRGSDVQIIDDCCQRLGGPPFSERILEVLLHHFGSGKVSVSNHARNALSSTSSEDAVPTTISSSVFAPTNVLPQPSSPASNNRPATTSDASSTTNQVLGNTATTTALFNGQVDYNSHYISSSRSHNNHEGGSERHQYSAGMVVGGKNNNDYFKKSLNAVVDVDAAADNQTASSGYQSAAAQLTAENRTTPTRSVYRQNQQYRNGQESQSSWTSGPSSSSTTANHPSNKFYSSSSSSALSTQRTLISNISNTFGGDAGDNFQQHHYHYQHPHQSLSSSAAARASASSSTPTMKDSSLDSVMKTSSGIINQEMYRREEWETALSDPRESSMMCRPTHSEVMSDVIGLLTGPGGPLLWWNADKTDVVSKIPNMCPNWKRNTLIKTGQPGIVFNQIAVYCEPDSPLRQINGYVFGGFLEGIHRVVNEQYYTQLIQLKAELDLLDCETIQYHLHDAHRLLTDIEGIIQQCKNLRGGGLINGLKGFCSAPWDMSKLSSPLHPIMVTALRPYHSQLLSWLMEGMIDDPMAEFMIECKDVDPDDWWNQRFKLRPAEQIPFYLEEFSQMILEIGRGFNFLDSICDDPIQSSAKLMELHQRLQEFDLVSLLNPTNNLPFQMLLNDIHLEMQNRILRVMNEEHHLQTHFEAIRKYVLLNQGEFVSELLDALFDELNKSVEDISAHKVSDIMTDVIRNSNARNEPEDVQYRIQMILSKGSFAKKSFVGWDVHTVSYVIPTGPLMAVFNSESKDSYRKISNFLWKLARIDYGLCRSWTLLNRIVLPQFTAGNTIKCNSIVHELRIQIHDTIQFLNVLRNYFVYEALEKNWLKLKEATGMGMSKDLAAVNQAHRIFLQQILLDTFQDQKYKDVRLVIESLLDSVLQLSSLSHTLANRCMEELSRFLEIDLINQKSSSESRLSGDITSMRNEQSKQDAFIREMESDVFFPARNLKDKFKEEVRMFLELLAREPSSSLLAFAKRLNWDERYTRANQTEYDEQLKFGSEFTRRYTMLPFNYSDVEGSGLMDITSPRFGEN